MDLKARFWVDYREKLLIAKLGDKNHRAEKKMPGEKAKNKINLKIRRKSAEKLFVVF